ncbi:hypothetical protein GA0115240_154742 [Streptomyces sp. DvalAA-14]|uniref:PE-PGRS family protein n=1 Tax=unclassified Streptomyces TaxID=2593676 RepID=UPI00081B55AE|nr:MULTISPECIES: PE-PGRS family protein [unclassified Streptomyces]MYS23650.1 PE-PGRS family protein [Streptomyces sp. SID4948]SCE36656.1 hypothetical protein GA0115240_154742 [Streptomyces sp. DvalAA-14]
MTGGDNGTPAAAWSSVLRRQTASAALGQAWREGLARHRAAPAPVLLRLLDVAPGKRVPAYLTWRKLPEEVVSAWLAHPEWRVRFALAGRGLLSPEERAQLFQDPDPKHRLVLLVWAVDDQLALTEATFTQLANDPDPRVRAEAALHRHLPTRHLVALATDPDPQVRRCAVPRAWTHLEPSGQAALLADPDPGVRADAVIGHHRSTPLSAAAFAGLPDDRHRERAAEGCELDRELAETLVRGAETALRGATALNAGLDADLVALLGQDPDPQVRLRISVRPDLTEAERSRIAVELAPNVRYSPVEWVRDLADDAEAMRRCATSSHVLLRRDAACARNLPDDVVDLLAHDEDWVVRLLLAEHCDQAPAELLLEMVRTWEGYSAARLVEHPNFPREHTLSYADDPHPRMRELALLDPEAPADLVERLSRDPDNGVRWRALRDERLSSASVIRLLDDPDHGIRNAAAADSRLPAHVLAGLLYDTATAAAAAANPVLPESVMHHLLDRTPPTAPA